MIAALLRLEAVLALLSAWLLVFGLPLRWLELLLGRIAAPSATSSEAAQLDAVPAAVLRRAGTVAKRLTRAADRLPWNSTCLVQAVALGLLLARRGIAGARIRFGVRKRDGALEAHAWLLLGPDILLGGKEAESYVPLADLAASVGESGRGRVGHGGRGGR